MLTLDEYLCRPRSVRILYRLYRNPTIFLVLGSVFYFVIKMRLPNLASAGTRQRNNIWHVNLMWTGVYIAAGMMGHAVAYLLFLHLVSILVGGGIGLWLFFIQHQYEHTSWWRGDAWEVRHASLYGSSFLKLPPFLEWLLVWINIHHVHHADPRIPNYRLREGEVIFQTQVGKTPVLTLVDAVQAFQYKLWDERNGRLVPFPACQQRGQE